MTQEYKHFRRKLDFIQYLIKEKGASIDLNQTMRCGGAWWIDNDGTQYKAINSTEFLKMLDEKYNLNIDYEKSLARGYKTFIIFDKDSTETAVESVETLVEETEEEVVETTEETTTQDTEVKATKRGTRKSTVTK
jgi:hypothetical protein